MGLRSISSYLLHFVNEMKSPWAQSEWCSASAAGFFPSSQSDGSQADPSVPENLASVIVFVVLFKEKKNHLARGSARPDTRAPVSMAGRRNH